MDVCGGRLHLASKTSITRPLFNADYAVFSVLHKSVIEVRTGCLTADGESAELGARTLGITWHIVE